MKIFSHGCACVLFLLCVFLLDAVICRAQEQYLRLCYPFTKEIWAQNYHDPFNPTTTIVYHLPAPNHVSIKVFDVYWRVVAELLSENETAGTHEVSFDGTYLPSGTYFYQIQTEGKSLIRSMILIK